ncbi:MAG: hypothetical protein JW892_12160 [Anaerolineae bacterium]|nr:hypothetical protein [Anaerolineae bacterium]
MTHSDRETQLWYWLLYSGVLPTTRAKNLLSSWSKERLSVESVLDSLPLKGSQAGLNDAETRALKPPPRLETITALRWNEDGYPKGLETLDLKLRPALLFYQGNPKLLARPLLAIPPAPLDTASTLLLQETLGQVLGDATLLAATHGSAQAAILLNELTDSEGDALLYVRQGLNTIEHSKEEQRLLVEGRLLLLSPLNPTAPANPKWEPVLSQVELAAAEHILWVSSEPPTTSTDRAPTLWLTPTLASAPTMTGLRASDEPGDVLLWLLEKSSAPETPDTMTLSETPVLPPLPPDETLRILERGGAIPEALRQRLLKH